MFRHYRLCAYIFLTVILCVMLLAVRSGISHKVTNLQKEISIDWEKLYPFETDSTHNIVETKKKSTIMKLYSYIKKKAEEYSSSKLPGRFNFVGIAKVYESFIGWNFVTFSEYNGVVKRKGDYLVGYAKSVDISENAEALIKLNDFCHELGIEFAYFNYPGKICIYEDGDISGILDYSNQNANRLLDAIAKAGVRTYDFRKLLHEDGMNHHEAFYRTDHHWKVETGLWAAKHILQIFKNDYGWNVEPDALSPENFDYVVYHEWAFGSQGKKLTHFSTYPDDFTMIYPKFATNIYYEIPNLGINTSGDFAITYDMSQVETKDLYELYPYTAYNRSDHPLMNIRLVNNSKKNKSVLILKESYSNCVIPFLALGVLNVSVIDLRHFTGSLKTYIRSTKPDMVIIAYSTGISGCTRYSEYPNYKFYDFR